MGLLERAVRFLRRKAYDELRPMHTAAHVSIQEEGDPAEHLLFDETFAAPERAANPFRQPLVEGHLHEPRYQRPGAAPIAVVGCAERRRQCALLEADLAPVGDRKDGNRQQRMQLARHERGAGIHREHGGIDRVTDQTIGTGLHELMIIADAYLAAPVAAQVPARPDRQGDADVAQGVEGAGPPRIG